MTLRDEVQLQRDTVLQIAARHGARMLFGSVARGEERPDSDIELLIAGGRETYLSPKATEPTPPRA